MAYNTNNPVPSSDPRDLFDNAESFDQGMNSTADTFRSRRGQNLYTWAFFNRLAASGQSQLSVIVDTVNAAATAAIQQMEQTAAELGDDLNNKHASTYAQLVALPQTRDAVVGVVDADPDQAKNGWYWWDNVAGVWKYFLNQPAMVSALIASGTLHATEAVGRSLVLDGQTFYVQGAGYVAASIYRRVNATTSTLLGRYLSSVVDQITVNSGKNFPLQPALRDAVTSTANLQLNDFLVDLKVINADPTYVYRLGYFGNGSNAFGETNKDRIFLYKYKKATYATASARENCIDGSSIVADFVRDGSVQTRTVLSNLDPGVSVVLTIDTSKITTAYGTAINYESAGRPASWSWTVSEAALLNKLTTEKFSLLNSGTIYYEYASSTKSIQFTYRSGLLLYRVTLGISNYNNIPNIKKIEYRVDDGVQGWVTAVETTGDWLPPIKIKALTGNVDSAALNYTSGNHGAGGAANGYRTAKNLLFKIYIDGQLINDAVDSYGFCSEIGISVVNAVRAANTIDSQPITYNGTTYNFTGAAGDPAWIEGMVEPASTIRRYVLHQCFNMQIIPESISVECILKELEPVQIWEDNGPQSFTLGFNTSIMFAEGVQGQRIAFVTGVQSGKKSDAPKAWAVSFQGAAGQLVAWMDRSYGVGDGRNVDANSFYIRMGVNANTKCYHAATMAALPYDPAAGGYRVGDDYKWRGGWAVSQRYSEADFDTVFRAFKDRPVFAYVSANAKSMTF